MNKNSFIQRINNSFAKFAEWVLDHRLTVIALCLIMIIEVAFLSTKLRFDFNPFVYSPDGSVATKDYEELMKEYGNDEFLYVLYNVKQGIFDIDALRKTKDLARDLKSIPYVKRVHSITNLEFMEGSTSGEIKVVKVMDGFPANQFEADRLKKRLMDKPLFLNIYISKDAEYAAILCEIDDKPEGDPFYTESIVQELNKILAKPGYRDFTFYPTGIPVASYTTARLFNENTILLTLPSSILLLLLLFYIFRQFKGIIGPNTVILFSILMVIAFLALTDLPLTMMCAMIPGVLMAVAIADGIHIVSEYQIHLKAGNNNRTSILEAVKLLGFPCLFTSITTAIGFGSLLSSEIGPIRDIGLSIAFGTMAAFVVTFTLLLVVLSFSGEKTEKKFAEAKEIKRNEFIDRMLWSLANFNNRNHKGVLAVSILICVILIYGITKIEVNTSNLANFGDRIPVYHDFKFVDKTMGGTSNFEILLDSNSTDGIKRLEFIQTLQKIQDFAETKDYLVRKTVSVVDMIKEVNRALHNNDRAFYSVPAKDGEDFQNVNELLFELYGSDDLDKFISSDFREARLTIYVTSTDTKTYKRFYDELVSFIDSVNPADYTYKITGVSYLTIDLYRNLTGTMIESLTIAIILISIMMIIVFRSFKTGLISMIPNVFPVIFVLGYLGLSGTWLSHITAIATCIMIGIAVDDTIHFVSRYRMEFDRLGDYRKALEVSMRGVGQALVITTIALVTCFGLMLFSRTDTFYYTGLVTTSGIVVALAADFMLAPALILVFKPFGKEFTPANDSEIDNKILEVRS